MSSEAKRYLYLCEAHAVALGMRDVAALPDPSPGTFPIYVAFTVEDGVEVPEGTACDATLNTSTAHEGPMAAFGINRVRATP